MAEKEPSTAQSYLEQIVEHNRERLLASIALGEAEYQSGQDISLEDIIHQEEA